MTGCSKDRDATTEQTAPKVTEESTIATDDDLDVPAGQPMTTTDDDLEMEADVDVNDEAIEAEASQERDEFITETRQELDEIEHNLGQMRAKMATAGEEARAEMSQEMDELREEQRELSLRLDRASEASDAEWEELKADMSAGVDRLEAGYNSLLDKMKTD